MHRILIYIGNRKYQFRRNSIQDQDLSYVLVLELRSDQRPDTPSYKNADSRAVVEEFELNLRASCLDCMFFLKCKVQPQTGSPQPDALIGHYKFSALRDLCVS